MAEASEDLRQMIREHLQRGDALGWFEELYRRADGDPGGVPWARLSPRPELHAWIEQTQPDGTGQTALVIGCGLGDDAEALAQRGYAVTAFDVSQTAIDWCHRRFPDSAVNYLVADLFDPPGEWLGSFHLVPEIFLVQALPPEMRAESIAACARFVAPGGLLLAIGMGIDDPAARTGPPWPLTPDELAQYERHGLARIRYTRTPRPEHAPVYGYLAEFQRPL